MMSGHGNIATALAAIKLGAIDFLEKPLAVERLLVSLHNALERRRLESENRRLRESSAGQELLGDSAPMVELRAAIEQAAPADSRVLITGENGTGKELVARALHRLSTRHGQPFIKVNCAAIPSELLESELFGHEKGAFTGAIKTRRGKFELAQHGTLLLDEIGDMNPTTQAKLLRVLEENELERVGAERSVRLDVRVLAATNQDLEHLIEGGQFRRDLFFRLCVIPLHVPALRDHASDVPSLATHYLQHFARENGTAAPALDEDAIEAMLAYSWPGNVRELRNLMERLLIMLNRDRIRAADLRGLLQGAQAVGGGEARAHLALGERLEDYERACIAEALERSGGNAAEAARDLGVDRANLHRKMKRLGIDKS
jgi:two-component system nitrogen regulation response regulator NtrX